LGLEGWSALFPQAIFPVNIAANELQKEETCILTKLMATDRHLAIYNFATRQYSVIVN
jgi:hypothetical protein